MTRRILALIAVAFLALLPANAAATRTELVASSAFTSSGNSAAFTVSTAMQMIVGVDVTAVSGTTPLLDAWLQVSEDGGTTWYDMPADWSLKTANTAAQGAMFPSSGTGVRDIVDAANATGDWIGVYNHLASDRVRLKWIIGGTTPSFTFSASMVTK